MSSKEVKGYLSHHHISQLLESLLTGLLYHRPEDPIIFLQSCLMRTRRLGGPEAVTWDTFIHLDNNQLSPPPSKPESVDLQTGDQSTPITPLSVLLAIPQLPPQPPQTPPTPSAPPSQALPGPQALSTQLSSSALQPLTPRVHTTHPYNIPSAPPHTTPEHRLLPSPSLRTPPRPVGPPPGLVGPGPGPEGAVSVHADTSSHSREARPPGRPVLRSQLSIDSDSDLTESSGLLQEISILPPQRPQPLVIFIIGGPGSGKGTQATKLTQYFGLRGISLDSLYWRQLQSDASPGAKWKVITEMMSHGQLGPQEDTISELKQQLIGQQEVRGFILDGFPQDVHQALSFQEQIGSPDLVMLLLCSNETLRCRLKRRATQLGLLGDSSHTLRRRLDTFQREIDSISKYYRQLHLLTRVDADRDQEAVFAELSSIIRDKLLVKERSDVAGIPECISAAAPSASPL